MRPKEEVAELRAILGLPEPAAAGDPPALPRSEDAP